MKNLIIISISALAVLFMGVSGEYLYTDFDSVQIDGYVKVCRDSLSCELEFFKIMIYSDSGAFRVSSNDTVYKDLTSLAEKTSLLYSLMPFISDIAIDTVKKEKETLLVISYDSFKDTLFYKKKKSNPSSLHFKRDKVSYISYFSNIAVLSEDRQIFK